MRGNASPGWYPDPAGGGGQRYWDGRQWAASGPPSRQSKPGNWKTLAVVVAVGVGFPAVILAFLTVANNNRTATPTTPATETTTATATVTRQPSTSSAPPAPPPAATMPEWAGRAAPSLGTLGQAMNAVGAAALDTTQRPLTYWANLNAACRHLIDATRAVRANLPAPDQNVTNQMTDITANVFDAATSCSTFGPGTPTQQIYVANNQIQLADAQLQELNRLLRQMIR